jgi:hypothetical protein
VVPPEHVANRLGGSVELLGDLLHRPLDQFLTNKIELRIGPSSIFRLVLDAVLDDEPPTGLFRTPCVPLNADDGCSSSLPEDLRLSSHLLGFCAPVGETLGGIGEGCHSGVLHRRHHSKRVVRVCREVKVRVMLAALEGVWPATARCSDMTVLQRVATKRPNVHAATECPDRTPWRG